MKKALFSLVFLSIAIGAVGFFAMQLGTEPNGGVARHVPARIERVDQGDNKNPTEPQKPLSGAAQPQASLAQTGSQTASALVRFSSEAAKQAFLEKNDLSPSNLEYISALNVYSTNMSGLVAVEGTQLFEQRRYRALLTPNDTFYNNQWHLSRVNALPAWNNTMGEDSVAVAVIDTGFALQHEDLDGQWLANSGEQGSTELEGAEPNCTSRNLALDKSCNNIDDDGDGFVDNHTGWDFDADDNSVQAGETNPADASATHGTFVAGLVGAESSNTQGVAGVSWRSKILPIQALSDAGDGYTASVALAIRYAVDHGAKVINMSLGSDGDDPVVAEQISYALSQGVVVVAAAGNDGLAQLSYPANYAGVIAVGATDSSDNRASFSNYGANLALVAPGTSSICSTAWSVANPTARYVCGFSGTSFSSPIVAGAAALLLSQNSTLTPAQVKSALTNSATKVAGMSGQNFTTRYGYGRLNTYEALKLVSLAAPLGHVLNTHTISLAAVSGALRPEMNSTCSSYYANANCAVRAINTLTNQTVTLSDNAEPSSSINSYWNASTKGLSSGTWLVQAIAQVDGKKSLVREETLTITP